MKVRPQPTPSCFSEVGFDYPGFDVISTSGQATIDDCRGYCQENCVICTHFTHITGGGGFEQGSCWCKTSKAGRESWETRPLKDAITSGDICPQLVPTESRIVNTFQSSIFQYSHTGSNCPASMLLDNAGLEGNFICNLQSTG